MTTIMMTDIVGFTELNRQREELIRLISQKHANLLNEKVKSYGGRIINLFGDSAFALFEQPSNAVKCAAEIQHKSGEEPSFPMRIALHCGQIIKEGNEVYGEAINLTARILRLAKQGSVLCSDELNAILPDEAGFTTRSVGIFNLKYVERPVEIFALDQQGLNIPLIEKKEREISIQSSSVAVMPFSDLGTSINDHFLGPGISEAIIHALSRVKGISIISRSSSFAFSRQHGDIKEAGRLLGVAYVLEGSIQKQKNRIRVRAQLINAMTGFHEFSECYDKELKDLFLIQEEIAWLIAQSLKQEIKQKDKLQMALPKTSNTKALEKYLQASHLMKHPGKEDILQAIELFLFAIEEDEEFPLPYTAISICYTYLGALKYMDEEESYLKSGKYARMAMQIDPELPEAMLVHALSSFWVNNWNLKNAQQVISDALSIAPGAADIRLFHGMFTLISGNKKEALTEILLANKLDPMNPNILSRMAYTYLCLEDYEEAHNCFRLAHNTAPFAMYINYILSWSYLLQGEYLRAESALHEVNEEKDVYQSIPGTQGFLDARLGRESEAYEQIRQIGLMNEEGRISFPHYNYSLVYAGLGKRAEMYYHLEKAFSEKPVHLMFIQADPFWDPYRNDSRFMQMINRIFKRSPSSGKIYLQSETREKLGLQSDDILYISAEDNYSRVVWTEGKKRKEKVLRATLKHLEDQVSGADMLRCHRSYLVNCSRYKLQGNSRNYRLTTTADSMLIPVSRTFSKKIRERML